MTTLLLIRHGESMANFNHEFVGHTDVDLSPRGLAQAQKTAEFIKENYKIDKVYASDLQRAYKTGKCVSDACGVEIISDPGLREIYAGDWEGRKGADLLKESPEYLMWKDDIGNCTPPNGESVKSVYERIPLRLLQIAIENEGKTIAIATHATPIRCVISKWMGLGLSGMKLFPWAPNASVTEVTFENDIFMITKAPQDKHLLGINTELGKNF